jgi:glyoxylase-like metal-dependent hydrolase (beta-lactamase superfamily II)
MKMRMRAATFVSLTILLSATPVGAQQEFQDVQIQTVPVADGVFMLRGRGGNIGLSVGRDGAFVVDDQYAPLTEKIKAAIAAVTDHEVRFVVNTHWHFDHTGGNENFGEAGALIVAQENVRKRMSIDQFMEAFDRHVPAAPAIALPVITFTDAMTFHWNGDDIHVVHAQHAHTDGDALIHFRKANAIHMGDTYFNGSYPFIDAQAGGTIDGVIAAAEWVLRVANSDTKIMPGHGPLSHADELRGYRNMLIAVRDRVRAMINDGRSIDEVVTGKPTRDFDAEWGAEPDDFVRWVYQGMVRR